MIFIGQRSWQNLDEATSPPVQKKRLLDNPFEKLVPLMKRARDIEYASCNQQEQAAIAKLPFEVLALILQDAKLSFKDRLAFTSTCKRFLSTRVSRTNSILMEIFTELMSK